jgi:hypothetical protein
MISCVLMGGLGNQLFQIFATIAYALENKKPFGFMYTEYLGGVGTTIKRNTYWDSFLVPLKNFTHETFPRMPMQREKGFEYSKLDPITEGNDLLLFGYFQSYKYFDKHVQAICRLIKLDKTKVQVMNKYPLNFQSISMHFRLGDYKNLVDYHPVLDYEYYEKALQYVINNTEKRDVLYFCEKQDNNDVQKTIDQLKEKFQDVIFTKADDTIEDWEQLILMSCCKYNIIANSTFSWWAAQMNHNNYKIICYPEKWFGSKNAHLDTKDLFPEEWVGL